MTKFTLTALFALALFSCSKQQEPQMDYGHIHVENGCYCNKKLTPGFPIDSESKSVVLYRNIGIGAEEMQNVAIGQRNVAISSAQIDSALLIQLIENSK